jgi:Cu/Ag efflux pump CusA
MFEPSLQAKFVAPMANALGFAVLYATVVTLVLVPCLYMVLEDIKRGFVIFGRFIGRLFSRKKASVDPSPSQI